MSLPLCEPAQPEAQQDIQAEGPDESYETCIICGIVTEVGQLCSPCGLEANWWYL